MGTLGTRARNGKKWPRRVEHAEVARPAAAALREASHQYRLAVEQHAATAEILSAISESPGVATPVFRAIVQKAHRLCDAAYAVLYRYDGDVVSIAGSRHVDPKAIRALGRTYPQKPDRAKMVGRTVLEAKVFHTPDITKDLRFPRSTSAIPRRSLVAVPLLRKGRVLGAISC